MPQAKIKITPPFDIKLSLRFATACRFESEADCREGRFHRMVDIGGTPVLLTVTAEDGNESATARVSWSTPCGGEVRRAEVLKLARHIISADLDLGPFYKMASKVKLMSGIVRDFRGLKPIMTPSVYEAAAWAVMGQQVNLNFAYTLKKRVTEKYGSIVSHDNREYPLFPPPDRIAGAEVAQLRRLQFSNRKAEYLIGLSKLVAERILKLEQLNRIDYTEALETLLAVRGIGIWSANYILMRGAGHLDCLPLGDSGLHRAVKNLYKLKTSPDNEKVAKAAEPFKKFRSLYTLYLWYSLLSK